MMIVMIILVMTILMINLMMILMMMIMMMKPYENDDDTDDDNDHKNDSYAAAGAVPGASVPCSLLLVVFYVDCASRRSSPSCPVLIGSHTRKTNTRLLLLFGSNISQATDNPDLTTRYRKYLIRLRRIYWQ